MCQKRKKKEISRGAIKVHVIKRNTVIIKQVYSVAVENIV